MYSICLLTWNKTIESPGEQYCTVLDETKRPSPYKATPYGPPTILIWHFLIGDRGERGLPGKSPHLIPGMLLEVKGGKGDEGQPGIKGTLGVKGKKLSHKQIIGYTANSMS